MNETLSLLLATSILAAGGLGLYMYKSTHDGEDEDNMEETNEQAIELSELDVLSMNEIKNTKNKASQEEENYKEPEQKITKRGGGYKTKRNRKMTSSKRKY